MGSVCSQACSPDRTIGWLCKHGYQPWADRGSVEAIIASVTA
jgi:hypothetical protein